MDVADLISTKEGSNKGDLEVIGEQAHDNAEEKGFYEDYYRVRKALTDPRDRAFLKLIWLSHRLMLIVSECAEGLEGVRADNMSCLPGSGGLGEELSDIQIRLSDLNHHLRLSESTDMPTSEAVGAKMQYNRKRPRKHGKVL